VRERHVREDGFLIHFCHKGDFAKITFPFPVLVLEDMALALFTAQHLTRRSNFESFRDGFSCFGYTSVFGHRGGEGGGDPPIGKVFLAAFWPLLNPRSEIVAESRKCGKTSLKN
jgi:hypothetical protein